jgi:hypothetical protein
MPSLFKFTRDRVTRRVTFPTTNTTWLEIANKIEDLYGTPFDTVGVVYVDAEGDEITISTQEELLDYYRLRGQVNSLIKFNVVDLDSSRDKPLPDTPRTSRNLHGTAPRNTFGVIPFSYEGDEDWQRIPGFGGIFDPPTDGMRFVELASDAGSRLNDNTSHQGGSAAGSDSASTAKGKSRHAAESMSSNESVMASDTPIKPPVHISTPRQESETIGSSSDAIPDPPLPDLEPPAGSTGPSPSLTNDVAALLSTITTTFSSHPELADGLRNILRNVGNGSYLATHRAEVARAAEQIRRSSQDLHAQMMDASARSNDAEQQASRRIAEAVGNIVRSLSDMAINPNGNNEPNATAGVSGRLWSTFGQPRERHDHHRGHHHHPRGPHHHHHHPHPPHGHDNPHNPFRHGARPSPPHHDPSWPFGWHVPPPPMPWMGPHPPPPPPGPENDDSEDDSDEVEDAEVSMYGISQRLPLGVQKERLQAAKAAYIAEKQKYRQEKQVRRRERMQRSNL